MAQNVEVGLTSSAEKRYFCASDISGSITGRWWPRRNFRLEYYILNLLGKTFCREFIKTPLFFQTVKIKIVITYFHVYFHWEISVIHRKAYKKCIKSWKKLYKLKTSKRLFWNLQQMTKVRRCSCWHKNFVPKGLSTPASGLYTCIKSWKKMYKIRL